MIITKVHIENFGTLHNFDLALNDNINQICQANGWGKSTFSIFLKAMFYGMSAKSRGNAFSYERSKYMPWQGGNYGGYVEFLYQNQPYRLTRYFGKTPEGDRQELLNLTTMKLSPNPTSEIGQVMFGVGRDTFEITAYFPQLDFMPTENGEIRAGLTGANKFQDDQSNFEKAIKIIDGKITQTKKELKKKEEIEKIKIALSENIAYQSIQKTNYSKLLSEVEKQNEEIDSQEQLLDKYDSENKLLKNEINEKRAIENKIQEKTQALSRVLIDKSEEVVKFKTQPNGKRRVLIASIVTAMLVAGFGALCLINLICGLIGLGLSGICGMVFILYFVRKKPQKQTSIHDYDVEIKCLSEEINCLKDQLAGFSSNEGLIDNTTIIAKINALKVDSATKNANILNLERDIARLENEEEEMNFSLSKIEENNSLINKKLDILTKTKEYMLLAEENVSQRFISPFNSQFKSLLEEFGLADRNFVVDGELSIKENTIYGQKELEYSSQGLKDILSFCQRINLATQIFGKERPFIVLDDTFVNLDDKNLELAKNIVRSLSKEYQIIYICCNSRCKIEKVGGDKISD